MSQPTSTEAATTDHNGLTAPKKEVEAAVGRAMEAGTVVDPEERPLRSSETSVAQETATGTTVESRRSSLVTIAANQKHVGIQPTAIRPTDDIFNVNEERIKEDIVRMVVQYLHDGGYHASKMTLLDEANVKTYEREERQIEIRRMRKAVLDGDWAEVDRLCSKTLLKNQKSFLYAVYKQQYLEYIEHHEIQKAFTHLNKRIKPLEHLQTTPNEFKDLCYLLTAKSALDAPSFKNWDGITGAREKLAEQFQNMIDFESADREGSVYVPPQRLLNMLRQAVAYQIESSRYHPRIAPRVTTLLEDYQCPMIPNAVRTTFAGHKGNVKCVDFIGEEGLSLISGSSDNTCRIWNTETGECQFTLEGHASRIWDVTSNKTGTLLASASGDGTVKLWDHRPGKVACSSTLEENQGDVYSVRIHPAGRHVVTGGYDKTTRLYDIERGVVVKSFTGHQLSVSQTIFNPLGNLVISGSKDNTIKFWDIVSGLCIRTITSHLGEVTCVEMSSNGTLLLSSSKDNSNRLWDIRMLKPIRKFKGHQNTSTNFVKASFAGDALVVGGSEDGIVYIWDSAKGDILQKLRGHRGVVYGAVWASRQSLFASCSDDRTVKTWWFDEKQPLFE
ncbi:WD40-repeat-containing domain protein [Fimicolochytrium jonesii]|uniref:WD40-repeat-containing domain protein n=1 Tax=Fimicolochytrium jonesii TaxID=1396493 RepID=UPI0022FE6F81|nr:WD40-repeat-containing domain protein [Fimicolochytrium jonesii]KAI8819010.1 WD40-repeat-containing domain protein [Fimicolochytrium jonesii]